MPPAPIPGRNSPSSTLSSSPGCFGFGTLEGMKGIGLNKMFSGLISLDGVSSPSEKHSDYLFRRQSLTDERLPSPRANSNARATRTITWRDNSSLKYVRRTI
ncbi:hypothetical protein J3459_012155 [Metarhizium acridum]|nr:hypothetical protein J3459_012155 [Metarhizium acridum]